MTMERCLLCEPEKSRVLAETGKAYAIYSLWPVSDYHTLIVPVRHLDSESQMTSEENDQVFQLRKAIVEVVAKKSGMNAYNFGANVGTEAGQTSPHLHYHVIFRAPGDSGDSTGGVRAVIPGRSDPGLHENNGFEKVTQWTNETKPDIQTTIHRTGATLPN